jgi:hypothetical protein
MRAKSYLLLFLCLCGLLFAAVASFNYVVDPYRFFNSPDRPGINEYRQRFFYGQYTAKPYALREQSPNGVILGVSRAGSALATDHPGWQGYGVYNYAMAGSTAYLLWRNYQHAKASGDLKRVVLMLDFYMFNVHQGLGPLTAYIKGYEERLAVTPEFTANRSYPIRKFKDTLTSLISFEMAYESWNTVRAQSQIANRELYKATLTNSGFWINDPPPKRTQRWLFHHVERQYMTITWFPRPDKRFALSAEDGSDKLIYLERIITDAHREGIDLRLGSMPFHARLAESMHAVELWDDFEQWKLSVVALVEEQASMANRPPFPLWDFTGYNQVTTEAVPLNEDKTTRMRWHLDPTHVSRATGDLVQTVMLQSEGERLPDFGQRVDSSSMQQYLDHTREQRAIYVAQHPKDMAEIAKRAKQTAAWRAER